MRTVIEKPCASAGRGTAGYHVSLDMDWIDPEDAPVWERPCVVERHIAKRI